MAANTNLTLGSIPKYVKANPNSAAVLSKMNFSRVDKTTYDRVTNPYEIPMSVIDHIKNNESIEQLFPDIKLAKQILSSSVISPNNMISSTLTYIAPDINIPSNYKQSISDRINKHIEKYYRLESRTSEIFEDAMFTHGAVIEAIIPEAAVDEVINRPNDGQVTIEMYKDGELSREKLKYLSTENTAHDISVEDYARYGSISLMDSLTSEQLKNNEKITLEDLMLDITEDKSVFMYNKKTMKKIHDRITHEDFRFSMGNTTQSDLDKIFRPNDSDRMEEAININTYDNTSRSSIGAPMVFRLPVESVIPVHVVNDPSRHLGYFVLLDEKGTPINGNLIITEEQASSLMKNTQDSYMQNNIISKAKNALHGITREDPKLHNIEEIYGEIVEKAIKEKLNKGLYGEIAEIKNSADVYRVMFFRALKAKRTKLLYLPAENVMYYAFEFRENGTGKSLIEKTAMLHSIRAILLFSRVMATIKNSVSNTEVAVQLDEDDPDPQGTVERVKSQVMQTRTALAPFGVTTMKDIVDWTYKAGFKFSVTGANMPQMTVNTTDIGTSKIFADESTEDPIKEQIIMSFGLTPEIVQSGYASDFAATVVAKNLLFAKRVSQIQLVFNRLLTDHVRKLVRNDAGLRDSLKSYISDNIVDIKKGLSSKDNPDTDDDVKKFNKDDMVEYILMCFCTELEVRLPVPELTEAQALHDAFGAFKSALDENLEGVLSDDAFPTELVGAMGGNIGKVRAVIKTVLLRNWMTANNYMPELSEFVTMDTETKRPVFDGLGDYQTFVSNLRDVMVPFLKAMGKEAAKNDDKLPAGDGIDTSDSGGLTDTTTDDGGGEDPFSADTGDGGEDTDAYQDPTEIPEEEAGAATSEPTETEPDSTEPKETDDTLVDDLNK